MNLKQWSDRLVYATIVISVVRYAAAFAASDVGQIVGIWSDILTGFLSFTGIGMGILDTVGGALLFNGWSRVFPKQGQKASLRFKVLTLCVFGLLFSGLFILVPFTMSRISHLDILAILGGTGSVWAWIWSAMVNLIPYILIAGIFTGNKMVSSLEQESSEKVSGKLPETPEKDEKVSGNLPTDWRKIKGNLTDEQVTFIAHSKPTEISRAFAESGFDVSPRTASNWKVYALEEEKLRLENKG